jgi:hypothetical protein
MLATFEIFGKPQRGTELSGTGDLRKSKEMKRRLVAKR